MNKFFYLKLAWNGIRKNKRMYLPYILTSIGMVMMFYIIAFLNSSELIMELRGGAVVASTLGLGRFVITFFAFIFLFYTNSFLSRRRKKEFGLYNILGMGKKNLGLILLYESIIVAGIALAGGLLSGIALSKFAELGLVNVLHGDISYNMSLDIKVVLQTVEFFVVIFMVIFLNTLRQIHLTNPIELLHSEHAGEKPPRVNWVLAVLGVLILGAAYYIAMTIQDPVEALLWFFAAVIMVIAATYLLFVAGSVAVCRILQRNKGYYYKARHFVSVSSMTYRMKRNGAGLASICILCTMVLVMLSSTTCLYAGTEDSLRSRYMRNICIEVYADDMASLENDEVDGIRNLAERTVEDNGQITENVLEYRMAALESYIEDGVVMLNESVNTSEDMTQMDFSDLWQIRIVSLEDYNRLMGANETLNPGEVLVYTVQAGYEYDTISFGNMDAMKVKGVVQDFRNNGVDSIYVVPSIYIFVSDFEQIMEAISDQTNFEDGRLINFCWYYGFDMDCDDAVQKQVDNQITASIGQMNLSENSGISRINCEGVANNRESNYSLNGGFFFLGILLGIVFVFAAVLIMYYKQITEGYEDQSRFEIMQKVGMTKKDIRRSINSQVLTVFFAPLMLSGMHLAFAFPMIQKLLLLFGLTNTHLLIRINIICFLIFAGLYVLVYYITSKSYYHIVSGVKEER